MLVDIKFATGDKVCVKSKKKKEIEKECTFCGGKGEISGLDGTFEECPVCDGTGWKRIETVEECLENVTIDYATVRFNKQGEPEVWYIMTGWRWGYYPVKQEDIIVSEN